MKWQKISNISKINFGSPLIIVYCKCQPEMLDWFFSLLNENDLLYYSKFRNKTALQCRAVLRMLLSEYFNTLPNKIEILTTSKGKPYIANNPLSFNVSHSDSAFVIALSRKGRVGVDIEQLSGSEDIETMSDYAFSDFEKECVFLSGNKEQEFTAIWTLKEALLKALGVGLITKLNQVNVYEKLKKYKLSQLTFKCPEGETGSVVTEQMSLFKTSTVFFNLSFQQ